MFCDEIRWKKPPKQAEKEAAFNAFRAVRARFVASQAELLPLFEFYYTFIATPQDDIPSQLNCGYCVQRVISWFKNNTYEPKNNG